jgi:hypothetical protein
MKSVLSLALTALVAGTFSMTSVADERDRPLSSEGEPCDGRVLHPRMCADGLICSRRGMAPGDDGPGTCVREAHYGQRCGGFIRNAAECADGLVCTHLDVNGRMIGNPDGPGMCQVAEGGACGGNAFSARTCAFPLRCEARHSDLTGVCVP